SGIDPAIYPPPYPPPQAHRIWHDASAPSPRLWGEGRGEGAFPQAQTHGDAPSPGMSAKDPLILTSPRKRGVVRAVPNAIGRRLRGGEGREGEMEPRVKPRG